MVCSKTDGKKSFILYPFPEVTPIPSKTQHSSTVADKLFLVQTFQRKGLLLDQLLAGGLQLALGEVVQFQALLDGPLATGTGHREREDHVL
jgi:hypothetical protein